MGTNSKKGGKAKKEIAVRKNEIAVPRRLTWGGVMPKVGANEKDEAQLVAFCNLVAEVYGIPSTGINAMGGKPYINKDGRRYLLDELKKGKEGLKSSETEFIQPSSGIDVPSICRVTLTFKDGLVIEAIGEASKQSVKLEAVKSTLNMMAETRAKNRAIWDAVAHATMQRVAEKLEKMKESQEVKAKIINAGSVSYEEMQRPEEQVTVAKKRPVPSTPKELADVIIQAIREAKDVGVVIDMDTKAQKSDKLDKEQKVKIHEIANEKVNKLEK